jgi:hypothetical protein
MEISEALTAIRELEAIPEARRRYLAALVGTAPTDAERALIVLNARHECRTVREKTEADLRAELAARRDWAARNPQRPAEGLPGPSKRRYTMAEGVRFPEHRPVSVRYAAPTKTAPEKPERKPMNTPVRHHGSEKKRPAVVPPPVIQEEKSTKKPARRRQPEAKHGTVHRYNGTKNRPPCRCDSCKAAKVIANAKARGKMRQKKLAESNRTRELENASHEA